MEQETSHTENSNQSIPVVRNTIQIDIISKIMMYIEDIVVLAASLLEEKNFYDEFLSPSSGDLGGAIKMFLQEHTKTFKRRNIEDKELDRRTFSYAN